MSDVLLVRLSAMGDVCQSLGPVQALMRERPDLSLHFVTQTRFVPLLEHLGFASVIPFERDAGVRGVRAVRRRMRALRADVAIDLQGNWKSALITRFSGARRLVGAAAAHRQAPASGRLLRERLATRVPHPAWIAADLLRDALGAELESDPMVARLVAAGPEIDAVEKDLAAVGVDPTVPFDVFVVAPPTDIRAWPLGAMRRQAAASDRPTVFLTGPAESAVEFSPQDPVLRQASGSVRPLVALGHLVRQRGGRAYGPDVGATHVLASSGAATYVLFGPQDPQRTAPPAATVVIRNDPPPCMPCRARVCGHVAGPVCMDFRVGDGSATE